MLMPTKARTVLRFTLLAGAALLGACSSEVTAPAAARAPVNEATSMFVPSAAAKALIGVADGTYQVTVDPKEDNRFYLGPNYLSLPSNSVCDLSSSSYGPGTWDSACRLEKKNFTLTVVIKNAASAHPSIEFFPSMRFAPKSKVQLFMYAPHVSLADAKNWAMLYCPDKGACYDESVTDASLATSIDYKNNMVFRDVKHFSGYTVAERADAIVDALSGL